MPKILMCRPDYFDVIYEINPWMSTNNPVHPDLAKDQWQKLYDLYTQTLGWEVQLIEPIDGLPDMVFTANGALVRGNKVALPRFRQPDRQGETEHFENWFKRAGFTEIFLPKYDFEGEGDALFWNDILFAGYPWRTDKPAHAELAEFFDVKVIPMQLADARFYHLDTALTIIDSETVALYPGAFTEASVAAIKNLVPNVIEATHDDAVVYGLNAMSDGHNVVMPKGAKHLTQIYTQRGLAIHETPISEFQKSGGGVKCLTLRI